MSTTPKNQKTRTSIYVLKDPNTLEVRYVGKTVVSLHARLGQHIYDSKKSKNHRTNWINLILNQNKLPIIEEIDSCSWDESQNLEIYYISKYKSEGCNLVNSTIGGEGTLGNKVSEETIQKRKQTIYKKLPKVYQYNLDGTFVKEWDNAPEAAESLGAKNASGITRCCRKERFKYKNYIWSLNYIENPNIVCKDLQNNIEQRHNRNIEQASNKHYKQTIIARIISQESKLKDTNYIYIYSSNILDKESLLYEAISGLDASSYLNEQLNRIDIDINSRISQCIKKQAPYYGKYYISNDKPNDYNNTKHKCLLILYIDGNDTPFYGIEELSNYLNVNKTNIINNIKGVTKTINTEKYGKIKINWKLNREHCRLYTKVYGLSADEIEGKPFNTEDNIELTSEIAKGSEVM